MEFEWVKGHAGHAMNEAADERARAAATAYRDGNAVDAGPGFPDSARPAGRTDFVVGQSDPEPDLFSTMDPEEAPQPIAGSAPPRMKARLVTLVRAAVEDPPSCRRHPEFVAHKADGAESLDLPWRRGASVEFVAVDGLGAGAGLVRAIIGTTLVSMLWLDLPAGWSLRFAQATPQHA